jgi:hypothetical protein
MYVGVIHTSVCYLYQPQRVIDATVCVLCSFFPRLSFVVLVFFSFSFFFFFQKRRFDTCIMMRLLLPLVAPLRKYIFIHENACPGDANAEEKNWDSEITFLPSCAKCIYVEDDLLIYPSNLFFQVETVSLTPDPAPDRMRQSPWC